MWVKILCRLYCKFFFVYFVGLCSKNSKIVNFLEFPIFCFFLGNVASAGQEVREHKEEVWAHSVKVRERIFTHRNLEENIICLPPGKRHLAPQ